MPKPTSFLSLFVIIVIIVNIIVIVINIIIIIIVNIIIVIIVNIIIVIIVNIIIMTMKTNIGSLWCHLQRDVSVTMSFPTMEEPTEGEVILILDLELCTARLCILNCVGSEGDKS